MEGGNEREDALHLCLHLFIETCSKGKREGGSKRGREREREEEVEGQNLKTTRTGPLL